MKQGDIVLYKKEPDKYGSMIIERKSGPEKVLCKILDRRFSNIGNIVLKNEDLNLIYSYPFSSDDLEKNSDNKFEIVEEIFKNGSKKYRVRHAKDKTDFLFFKNEIQCKTCDTLEEAKKYIDEAEGKILVAENIISYQPNFNHELLS